MKKKHVILCAALLFALMLPLSACTDYEGAVDEKYEEWKISTDVIPDSDRESSSSIASSSSAIKDGSKYDATAKTLTDLRDSQIYKTVTIGTQTWMAENLNYDYNEGSAKSYCFSNDTGYCDKYGRMYLWSAAMDSAAVFSTAGKGCGNGVECKVTELGEVRGVCPEGWHLPNYDEWNTLFTAVGGNITAGTNLKSTSGWNSNGDGTDSFGFAVIPAGYRYDNGNFYPVGSYAYFWSSTEDGSNDAYGWIFYCKYESVNSVINRKSYGFSVRCLRDSNDEGGVASSSSSQAQQSSSSAKSSSSSSVIPDPDRESSSSIVSSSSAIMDASEYDATAQTLTDLRDNQTYKTVTVGTQTWMAENLNYDYNEGTAKSYCYNNSADSCAKYGRLYLWSATMDSAAVFSTAGKGCGYGKTCSPSGTVRGVCPEGWHLPSDDEWNTLFTAVGGTGSAGTKLKSTSGWYSNANGTDAFGFSGLPAGNYNSGSGDYNYVGSYADFWSSTEGSSYDAYYVGLYCDTGGAHLLYYSKNYAGSVRCLLD